MIDDSWLEAAFEDNVSFSLSMVDDFDNEWFESEEDMDDDNG